MSEKLFVLGHPVAHSKSPAMHNAAYRALGLDWEYGFADCAGEASARALLAAPDWLACNVTMPWKPLAFAYSDVRSEEAELAQGANVLVRHAGAVFSDNTDGKGCVAYLQRCGVEFRGARVSVCGTGPTSLAIFHACVKAGAGRASLIGRNREKACHVLDDYCQRIAKRPAGDAGLPPSGGHDACQLVALSYDDAGLEALASSDIILDATPLGMKPSDPVPFDTSALSSGQTVFDVVYGHGETALLAAARKAGCAAFDGAGMLVAQAVETVRDISLVTRAFEIPDDMDLFAIMADAAGFDLRIG